MSEQENLDISRVIGLIMENPQLIEQISSLAKQSGASSEKPIENKSEVSETEKSVDATPTLSTPTYQSAGHPRGNRAQLLGALKPYVSEERAKAIDSMISIADILDLMRAR
jgi:hypothetical protein